MQRFLIIPLFALCLSGCTGMSGHFGCNATASDNCTPVSMVNQQADAGDFDYQESGKSAKRANSNYAQRAADGYSGITPLPGEPIRYGEVVQKIWIAPYQDLSHNYHEPSFVYTVLKRPHWIGVPAQEIVTR